MLGFLKFLRAVIAVPFFAIIGLVLSLLGIVFNSFIESKSSQLRAQRKDLNKRKQQMMVVYGQPQKANSFNWGYFEEKQSTIDQEKRSKQKATQKRRKRKKLAKKSHRQNRK